MNYKITKNNIHIEDSYKITDPNKMRYILDDMREYYESDVFNRSTDSLVKEWVTHNNLYKLHYKRSHTKDVDLNYPQSWFENIVYFIGSFFVL